MLKPIVVATAASALFLGIPLMSHAATLAPVASYEQLADAAPSIAQFPDGQSAQAHCPSDQVVWLNTKTGMYHILSSASHPHGHGKHGSFVCRKEADAAGYHERQSSGSGH